MVSTTLSAAGFGLYFKPVVFKVADPPAIVYTKDLLHELHRTMFLPIRQNVFNFIFLTHNPPDKQGVLFKILLQMDTFLAHHS